MFDRRFELMQGSSHDFILSRRHTDPSPFSQPSGYDDRVLEQRSGFTGYQSQLQQKKIFGFEIFVDNDIIKQMVDVEEWFSCIAKAGNIQSIRFNLELNIPDLNGRNIQVYDKDMDRKYQSCRALLSDIYQAYKKIKRQPFSIIIFVPEGMVSLLIGTRGYQINKIMKESHTTIVVNQPINKMTYRTVKIQGYHSDIARACRIIYEILEDKSSIAYSIEKQPSQLDYTKAHVKTKFIFPTNVFNYLLFKKRGFIKKVEDETKCMIKFRQDSSCRILRKDEQLCVLVGKLEDVQAMLVMLINLIEIFYEEDEKKNTDSMLKMLIPSNYVTKLIGQKGYMIRDIIERSGGAQIKIMSDRQAERDARECIISINGTRENKIDASCLILEQIQCFKNGGPILQSGKSINQNLAQQFKNSIPLRNEDFDDEKGRREEGKNEEPFKNEIEEVKFIKNLPQEDDDKQQGLIEAEPEGNLHTPLTPTNEQNFLRNSPALINSGLAARKSEKVISPSRITSKSREKLDYKTLKKNSPSQDLRQDKHQVEIKMVIPKCLGKDEKQLKYIQSLSRSQIIVKDQVRDQLMQHIEGSSEMIIGIRGSMKNNSHCLKLLQKRIIRMSTKSSAR